MSHASITLLVPFALWVVLTYGQDPCGLCDSESCSRPRNCLAGLVKDSCDCCYVCGRKEGERCDHPSLEAKGFGKCGDDLLCTIRTDLSPDDPKEATCSCVHKRPLCGSDGITYENMCQLTEARYRRRDGLRAISREPCRRPPSIVSSPQNIRNVSRSNVAMSCEATGWPVPEITWHMKQGEGAVQLPGENDGLTVQSRTGPGMTEITSWLLFTELSASHESTYTCIAINDYGQDSASAQVYVIY